MTKRNGLKVGGVSSVTVGLFCQLMAVNDLYYGGFQAWYHWVQIVAERIMDEEEAQLASGKTPQQLIDNGWFNTKMDYLFGEAYKLYNQTFTITRDHPNPLNIPIVTFIYANTKKMPQIVDYCKAHDGELPPDFVEPSMSGNGRGRKRHLKGGDGNPLQYPQMMQNLKELSSWDSFQAFVTSYQNNYRPGYQNPKVFRDKQDCIDTFTYWWNSVPGFPEFAPYTFYLTEQ